MDPQPETQSLTTGDLHPPPPSGTTANYYELQESFLRDLLLTLGHIANTEAILQGKTHPPQHHTQILTLKEYFSSPNPNPRTSLRLTQVAEEWLKMCHNITLLHYQEELQNIRERLHHFTSPFPSKAWLEACSQASLSLGTALDSIIKDKAVELILHRK